MTTRPRLGRPSRQSRFLAGLCLGLALTFGVLVSSGVAHAPTPDAWPYAWRPNWIPGDPIANGVGSFGTSWVVFEQVTPGLIVALDPVTRLPVRPSAAQRAAAAAIFQEGDLLGPPDGLLPTERIPGGGELIHLQGRFQMFSVARRGADGRFTTDCSPDPVAASRPLAQPARRGVEK
ncbi:MAG TPA: hypothetical protein VJW75_04720 [Candidatus Eisenbacteria bacterium]|nr:hypothetical protein [Candidatus Eisenbacteria bacterium]